MIDVHRSQPTPDMSLRDFYERDFRPNCLSGKSREVMWQHWSAINHLTCAKFKPGDPMLGDLSDKTIDRLMQWMDDQGYAFKTIEATRWRLRAMLRYAAGRVEWLSPPTGMRPVNTTPAAINIAGPIEAHRLRLARERLRPRSEKSAVQQAAEAVARWLKWTGRPKNSPPPPPIRRSPAGGGIPDNTIAQLLVEYLEFAKGYYRTAGGASGEAANMAYAARSLETFFGHELVREFSPRKLKVVQKALIDGYSETGGKSYAGMASRAINSRINRIKRIFRWAVSEELAPPSLVHALDTVAPLRKWRSAARELPAVSPVDESTVLATLPYLPPVIMAMVQIQLLTGARPGEVCAMQPVDVDCAQGIWVYRPSQHKTEYRGRTREILIGPEAQKILEPYLSRDPKSHCFMPRDSEFWRFAKIRAARKSKVQPSQVDRSKPEPKVRPGTSYTTESYARAVRRGCDKAGVKAWSPNRLRHTAATKIRKQFGLEAAQAILGHARADVTQVYAERNMELAWDVVGKIG